MHFSPLLLLPCSESTLFSEALNTFELKISKRGRIFQYGDVAASNLVTSTQHPPLQNPSVTQSMQMFSPAARGLGKDSRTKKSPQFSCSLFPKLSEEGKVYDSYAVLFLLLQLPSKVSSDLSSARGHDLLADRVTIVQLLLRTLYFVMLCTNKLFKADLAKVLMTGDLREGTSLQLISG